MCVLLPVALLIHLDSFGVNCRLFGGEFVVCKVPNITQSTDIVVRSFVQELFPFCITMQKGSMPLLMENRLAN